MLALVFAVKSWGGAVAAGLLGTSTGLSLVERRDVMRSGVVWSSLSSSNRDTLVGEWSSVVGDSNAISGKKLSEVWEGVGSRVAVWLGEGAA